MDRTDTLIIGGGLSGIVTALELLDQRCTVTLVDRDVEARFGGMAKDSFGGITMFDTPMQRFCGIRDSQKLALEDWHRMAEFTEVDVWPKKWTERYVERSIPDLYEWLKKRRVGFFPVVHWVERGLFLPGNSVPRFHIVWGTGQHLVLRLVERLQRHPHRKHLALHFGVHIGALAFEAGRVAGASGVNAAGKPIEFRADTVILASGGICGDLDLVRKHWPKHWSAAPPVILKGAHPYADGRLHDEASKLGAKITHLDRQWHYAAGVRHPRPRWEDHGISLVPPRSALWMDARGKRIGPQPLVGGFDTRFLVEKTCEQPGGYTWQILNYKIALKELAASGGEHNEATRERRIFKFLKTILLGNRTLVDSLMKDCPDVVFAQTVEELAGKMNALTADHSVDANLLRSELQDYDAIIARGPAYYDDQLRRIGQVRLYRGDRARTCRAQAILDPKALPLLAIRERIVTRKTLGGLQTDLHSRVLDAQGRPIPALFAVGEAAGFGGGGIHGAATLEGTFLGSCILTGQSAANAIAKGHS